jgi:muramoyltetrapeptide carboxypeptidase
MNRKRFMAMLAAAGSVIPAVGAPVAEEEDDDRPILVPPYLKTADTVGITCPAGYITEKEVAAAVQQIENWGFKVKLGVTVGKREFTLGGTDEERTADFQQLLNDKSVKAIMCARGGYGLVRIVDKLNFEKFLLHPKWIIGFSDITVLHSHVHRNYKVASLHSKMCNSFPEDWTRAEPIQIETIFSIRDALKGIKMSYPIVPNEQNKKGVARGVLVGGNLKTIETLAASKSDIRTTGKILFVEDTGEYLYSIDRMFWNLKRTGKLDKLAGLIVGGFKVKPSEDPAEEFGKNLQEIVLEKVKEFQYPVCFDFPVGHQKNNYALKCGLMHALKVSTDNCTLTEIT